MSVFRNLVSATVASIVAIAGTAPASAQQAAASPAVELTAPGPEGDLGGLLLDAGPGAPVVLMIPGSGHTDRDGNSPSGVVPSTLRLLAEGLAARGIGSLRIDKRGMFSSKAAIADANAVTIGDYATDVRAWIDVARARTGAPCVWILGHSEGGLVALKAAQDAEGICGLILVAAPGRPAAALLREQFGASAEAAPLLARINAIIDALEAGRRVPREDIHPALLGTFSPAIQGYLIDLIAQDPAALARGYKGPVLIVQGGADLQVTEADASALDAAAPRSTLLLVPGMSHVLKIVEGEGRAANIATYVEPALPLAKQVVPAIADFVLARRD